MKVVTLKDIPILPAEGAAERTAGWTGPVARTRQTIIEPGKSASSFVRMTYALRDLSGSVVAITGATAGIGAAAARPAARAR